MIKRLGLIAILVWLIGTLCHSNNIAVAAPSTDKIPKEYVKSHFMVLERLDPKKTRNLWQKLVALHGDHESYSPDEVRDVTGPPRKFPVTPEQPEPRESPVPAGAFGKATAEHSLQVAAEVAPKKTKAEVVRDLQKEYANKTKDDVIEALAATKSAGDDPVKALHKIYGDQPWYTAQELRDIQQNGSGERTKSVPLPDVPVPTGWQPIVEGIRHFMIRQSWSDVLYSEDLTQPENAKKTIDDLVGAKFSWAGDFKADSDTWSAVGALILPMQWRLAGGEGSWVPEQVVLAPSISLNKVSTNGDPKKNVDELFYRIGALSQWEQQYGAFQLRGAFVYGTDTAHRAELPAFEVDAEPQIGWFQSPSAGHEEAVKGAPFATKYLKIGYKNILIPKVPELEDQTDNSLLDYQLRGYLHIEGGDLQQAGSKWNVVTGSFFRLGPTLELRVNAPRLVFGHAFGVTALYSYLQAVSGTHDHESLLKLDSSLALYENLVTHQKISFSVSYTKGGLDFTKADVDLLTVGLAVLF
jgi:hypothetical protein